LAAVWRCVCVPRTAFAGAVWPPGRPANRAIRRVRGLGLRDWRRVLGTPWPCRRGQGRAGDPVLGGSAKSFSSMEIAGAADVLVQQGRTVRGLRRRRLVEPVFEDRGD